MTGCEALAPIEAVLRPGSLALREAMVELRLPPGALVDGGVLALPAWTPGSYLVRDHARRLDRFEAFDDMGRRLETPKLDKQRWSLPPTPGPVVVRYRLLCGELTVRTNHLDAHHAQFIGAATFPYLEGQTDRPWRVRWDGWPEGWRVATVLPEVQGAHEAPDYDTLVDSPFELGTFEARAFDVDGTRFEWAITGAHRVDLDRLLDATQRIVRVCRDWFGGFPFRRYLFLLTFSPGTRGGLEHRDSTSLLADPNVSAEDSGFRELLLLVAHEFFHAWNAKRLRAPQLGPFDYARECPTTLLWFHEGFTSFMQYVILLRAGLVDWTWCARRWAKSWSEHAYRPGCRDQSLEASSWDAWIRFYKPDLFSTNTTVSYYEKGALVAWMMDAEIRLATEGRWGLEAFFQHLWGRIGDGHVTDADLREAYRSLVGTSPEPFWKKWISGTEALDPSSIEAAYGLRFTWTETRGEGWIGATFSGEPPVVANVLPGAPAERAGLSFGQEVLAV